MKNIAMLASLTVSLGLGCSESVTPDAGSGGDSGSGSDSGGGDAGPLASCGGFGGGTCAATEYCDYPDNICGAADGTGVCRPRPTACPDVVDPVCGCDGTIHGNECEANMAGADVSSLSGTCTPEAGRFACGYRFCSTDTYCQISLDDTGMPPSYACTPFPSACDGGGRDCTCVASEPCGSMCMQDVDGSVTVTCPGG